MNVYPEKYRKAKSHYPYDWVDSLEKLNFRGPPPQKAFDSQLKRSIMSDEEYEEVLDTYRWLAQREGVVVGALKFEVYHDFYLGIDVRGLVDVIEAFRKVSMKGFGLDPLRFVSLPSYSWECMLKKTGAIIELLEDEEMFKFYEKGKQGGISYVWKRESEQKLYSEEEKEGGDEETRVHVVDANALYGSCMSRKLAVGDHRWLTEAELGRFTKEYILSKDWEAENYSFNLEVDIIIPKEMHDYLRDYPAPYMNVLKSDLSDDTKTSMGRDGDHQKTTL